MSATIWVSDLCWFSTGKRNRGLYDIEVNPDEAEEVREMFALADKFGYGGRKIFSELRQKGMINRRTGKPFRYSTVANILRNIQYTGVLRSDESHSDVIPELQIVSQEQFERVGRGLEQRCVTYAKKFEAAPQEETGLSDAEETALVRLPRMVPVRNCGQSLLSGNIYCGHCGARMFSSTAKRTGHVGKEEKSECIAATAGRIICRSATGSPPIRRRRSTRSLSS